MALWKWLGRQSNFIDEERIPSVNPSEVGLWVQNDLNALKEGINVTEEPDKDNWSDLEKKYNIETKDALKIFVEKTEYRFILFSWPNGFFINSNWEAYEAELLNSITYDNKTYIYARSWWETEILLGNNKAYIIPPNITIAKFDRSFRLKSKNGEDNIQISNFDTWNPKENGKYVNISDIITNTDAGTNTSDSDIITDTGIKKVNTPPIENDWMYIAVNWETRDGIPASLVYELTQYEIAKKLFPPNDPNNTKKLITPDWIKFSIWENEAYFINPTTYSANVVTWQKEEYIVYDSLGSRFRLVPSDSNNSYIVSEKLKFVRWIKLYDDAKAMWYFHDNQGEARFPIPRAKPEKILDPIERTLPKQKPVLEVSDTEWGVPNIDSASWENNQGVWEAGFPVPRAKPEKILDPIERTPPKRKPVWEVFNTQWETTSIDSASWENNQGETGFPVPRRKPEEILDPIERTLPKWKPVLEVSDTEWGVPNIDFASWENNQGVWEIESSRNILTDYFVGVKFLKGISELNWYNWLRFETRAPDFVQEVGNNKFYKISWIKGQLWESWQVEEFYVNLDGTVQKDVSWSDMHQVLDIPKDESEGDEYIKNNLDNDIFSEFYNSKEWKFLEALEDIRDKNIHLKRTWEKSAEGHRRWIIALKIALGFIYPNSDFSQNSIFDEDVFNAVRSFQEEKWIGIDWIVGPETIWKILNHLK